MPSLSVHRSVVPTMFRELPARLFYECFKNILKTNAPLENTPPDFGRSVNPISTKGGGRLCPPSNTGTPGFSDLPTALLFVSQ